MTRAQDMGAGEREGEGMAMNETNVHSLNQNNHLLHKWMSKLRDYMYELRNPDD